MSKKKFFSEPETTEEEVIEEVEEKEYDDKTQNEYDEEIQDDTEELKVEEDSDIEIPEEEVSKTPDIGTVNCAKLNVRSMPSITSEIYGVLNMNDTVIITGDNDPLFYKIEFDEKVGYVMKEFINI